jgi:hypothetical protein
MSNIGRNNKFLPYYTASHPRIVISTGTAARKLHVSVLSPLNAGLRMVQSPYPRAESLLSTRGWGRSFSSRHRPKRLWGSHGPISVGSGDFSRRQSARYLKMTTHLSLVPKCGMLEPQLHCLTRLHALAHSACQLLRIAPAYSPFLRIVIF